MRQIGIWIELLVSKVPSVSRKDIWTQVSSRAEKSQESVQLSAKKLAVIVTRNVTLLPGAASETVEVSGIPPSLDTTTAQLQNTYQSKQLEDLPIASVGSGVINLSLLDAGVATALRRTQPSVSGPRPRNNNFTVEGVDNNDKSVTGPLLQLPNDAVDQFTVLQNQFSSEFGHSSGGQFNQTSNRAPIIFMGVCTNISRTAS